MNKYEFLINVTWIPFPVRNRNKQGQKYNQITCFNKDLTVRDRQPGLLITNNSLKHKYLLTMMNYISNF